MGKSRAIPAGAASLSQNSPAGAVLGSEQIPWLVMPALVCPALLKAKIPVLAAVGGQTRLSPVGSHSSQGSRGEVLVREDWGVGEDWDWKAALHQAANAAPLGSTKLLIVETIIAKISLLVSWCRQEQTHSWELY